MQSCRGRCDRALRRPHEVVARIPSARRGDPAEDRRGQRGRPPAPGRHHVLRARRCHGDDDASGGRKIPTPTGRRRGTGGDHLLGSALAADVGRGERIRCVAAVRGGLRTELAVATTRSCRVVRPRTFGFVPTACDLAEACAPVFPIRTMEARGAGDAPARRVAPSLCSARALARFGNIRVRGRGGRAMVRSRGPAHRIRAFAGRGLFGDRSATR